MDFIPNTDEDRKLMLKHIKVDKIPELFKDIPDELLLKDNLKIRKNKQNLVEKRRKKQ